MYRMDTGWVDMAGRTRTWLVLDAAGGKVAEVTTKQGAQRLLDILNGRQGGGRA